MGGDQHGHAVGLELRQQRRAPRRPVPGPARWSPRRTASAPAWFTSARAIATRCCCPPDSSSGLALAFVGQPDPFQHRQRVTPRPARAGLRCTRRGARVTLSSTLMCGNRLNAWNTMPIRVRTSSASTRGSVMSLPSSRIAAVVDRFQQVDAPQQRRLARAGRADQHHALVRRHRERQVPQHDVAAVGLAQVLDLQQIVGTAGASAVIGVGCSYRAGQPVQPCRRATQSVSRVSGIVSSTNSTPGHHVRGVVEGLGGVDLGLQHGVVVGGAQDRDQCRCPSAARPSRSAVAAAPAGPPAARPRAAWSGVGQAQGAGGRPLRRVHRFDAGSEHLGDVRRVGQHQTDSRPRTADAGQPVDPQCGHAEAEQVDHQQQPAARGTRPCRRWRPPAAGRTPGRAGTGPAPAPAPPSAPRARRRSDSRMLSHSPRAMSGSTCQP